MWLYNLHYFDHPSPELIHDWITENPPGVGNGWEPYPISLRMVNWIKAHLEYGNLLDDTALQSLASQAAYLEQSVEHHILANHLFANAKALTFAGVFFEGGQADQWFQTGLQLLRRELKEQILEDGAHFERSPMYHSLITEDLLDLINLATLYPDRIDSADLQNWKRTAERMLGWLLQMTHPDGQIAFFNDAAFDIAPQPSRLHEYAARLGITAMPVKLGDSGYVRLENGESVLLFDGAPIGPDYQPGHAHADTLSFELSHLGRRIIVNSGTSTYEVGEQRATERGTTAHSTVRIDRQDQSEVWSAFRVARRARPIDLRVSGNTSVEAGHTGYRRLNPPVTHRRRVELQRDAAVVHDSIEGSGVHEVEIYFHFHPEAVPKVNFDPKLKAVTENTEYYPGFNLRIPKKTAIGRWKGACPQQFTSVIPLG
mgnify:CR=1 FL=1